MATPEFQSPSTNRYVRLSDVEGTGYSGVSGGISPMEQRTRLCSVTQPASFLSEVDLRYREVAVPSSIDTHSEIDPFPQSSSLTSPHPSHSHVSDYDDSVLANMFQIFSDSQLPSSPAHFPHPESEISSVHHGLSLIDELLPEPRWTQQEYAECLLRVVVEKGPERPPNDEELGALEILTRLSREDILSRLGGFDNQVNRFRPSGDPYNPSAASVSCTGKQIKQSDRMKKFRCPECPFTFNSRGDLKRHMEKKNPSKMHWCGHASCQYIIRKDKFREHLDKHHNVQLSNEDLEKRAVPRRQKFPPRCPFCQHDLQSWEGWFNHWIDHTVPKANSVTYGRDNHDRNDENDDVSNDRAGNVAVGLPSSSNPVPYFRTNEASNSRNSGFGMRTRKRLRTPPVETNLPPSAGDIRGPSEASQVSIFLGNPDPFEELKSTGEERSRASWHKKLIQDVTRVTTILPHPPSLRPRSGKTRR